MTALRRELHVTAEIVEAFAQATGDRSSIHMDAEFARCTRFRRPIIHGLLPVACLLLSAHSVHPSPRWLSNVRCRFLEPAYIGDELTMEFDPGVTADGRTPCDFAIRRKGAEGCLTVGSVTFTEGRNRRVGTSEGQAKRFIDTALEENCLTIDDLRPGAKEHIQFCPAPSVLTSLVGLFDAEMTASSDANTLATLAISTLIGMRLPGRYATFSELEAAFDRELRSDIPVDLTGQVDKVHGGGGRLQLTLGWSQGGEVIGLGSAAAMVNRPAPGGIGCAELLKSHLDLGIAGKVVLVTGASRGIGEATAKLLSMHGAKVAVHFNRGRSAASEIVDDIRENGGIASAFQADLNDLETIDAMFAAIGAQLGSVEILINNAVGEFAPIPLESLTTADFLSELNVSVFGMHACCKAAIAHMRHKGRGKIINVGTIATEVPAGGQTRYIAVKSAVTGYTRSLAAELARDNIQVNLVVPRMTETSLLASLPPGLLKRLADDAPNGRLLQPIDVAKTILFLASDWATEISGQRLVLNQGEAPFL